MLHRTPNRVQKEAISWFQSPVILRALPGCGKSWVVARKIEKLLQSRGLHAFQLLWIVNQDIDVSQTRAFLTHMGFSKAQLPRLMSVDQIFLAILRQYARHLGLDESFSVISDRDKLTLISRIIRRRKIRQTYFKDPVQLAGVFSDIKRSHKPVDSVIKPVFTDYQQMLDRHHCLDMDDLPLLVNRLLAEHPHVLKELHEAYPVLFVDDYDRLTLAQQQACRCLVDGASHFVICYDPLGLQAGLGQQLQADLPEAAFPDAKVFHLVQNYRASRPILHSAQLLRGSVVSKVDQAAEFTKNTGESLRYFLAYDDQEEVAHIVKTVIRLRYEEGIAFDQIALMYRTGYQAVAMANQLNAFAVPYVHLANDQVASSRLCVALLSFLRLLVNREDLEALYQILHYWPPFKIPAAKLTPLFEWIDSQTTPLSQLVKRSDMPLEKAQHTLLKRLFGLMEDLSIEFDLPSMTNCYELVRGILTQTRLNQWIVDARLSGLAGDMQVFDHLLDWFKTSELSVTQALDRISFGQFPGLALATKGVRLVPMNRATNLECDAVLIGELEEGYSAEMTGPWAVGTFSEERQHLYHAMMSAKRYVFLSSAYHRATGAGVFEHRPSRIINDFGAENLAGFLSARLWSRKEEILAEFDLDDYQFDSLDLTPQVQEEEDSDFEIGDKVHHQQWGDGKVERIEEGDIGPVFYIKFQDKRRKLVGKYAHLSRVG